MTKERAVFGTFLRLHILVLLILISFALVAQKPRVGLVLSGGGAKGMAHVGVLKQLERSGIRPDFIVGTSMGSIIGAMYSLGYSADQIEAILREIDWDQILSNNIPLNYISYEEKEYYGRYLLEFQIVDGKMKLPAGLIQGQMLSEALNHFTWSSMFYENFDAFPIPFRCVATDVGTGKPVIFSDGALSEALRASMAIPTAFTAVDLDTTLVVDGGIVNNFPADVASDMGADIIIGMNVTRGFKDAYQVEDMANILMQMAMLSSNEKLPDQQELCDIYIEPDLDDYSTASFNKYDDILRIGHQEAVKFADKLDSISIIVGKSNFKPEPRLEGGVIVPGRIEFKGNHLFGDDIISSKLGIQVGDSVGKEEIEEGIRRVYGINGFDKVEYRLSRQDGIFVLRVNMIEKSANTFKTSFHYDNTFSAGIVLNYTARDLLLKSSRTILAGDVSENPKFRFDYYKYVGVRKRAAFNFRYNFINEQLPVYEAGDKIDVQINSQNTFSASLITTQKLKNSVFLGASYESNRYKSQFGGVVATELRYASLELWRLNLAYTKNSLDHPIYPTVGTERFVLAQLVPESRLRFRYENPNDSIILGSAGGFDIYLPNETAANELLKELTPTIYSQIYFRTVDYIRLGKTFNVIPRLLFGLTLSNDSIGKVFNDHYIGGNQMVRITDSRMFGLNYGEFHKYNFGMLGLHFQNVFSKHLFVKYGADFLVYYDYLPMNSLSDFDPGLILDEQNLLGYGVQLTYRSIIGPISIGASSNNKDGYVRFHFGLGFSFNYAD